MLGTDDEDCLARRNRLIDRWLGMPDTDELKRSALGGGSGEGDPHPSRPGLDFCQKAEPLAVSRETEATTLLEPGPGDRVFLRVFLDGSGPSIRTRRDGAQDGQGEEGRPLRMEASSDMGHECISYSHSLDLVE